MSRKTGFAFIRSLTSTKLDEEKRHVCTSVVVCGGGAYNNRGASDDGADVPESQLMSPLLYLIIKRNFGHPSVMCEIKGVRHLTPLRDTDINFYTL